MTGKDIELMEKVTNTKMKKYTHQSEAISETENSQK